MPHRALGILGLALGHPLAFARELEERGFRPTHLVYDESEEEERARAAALRETWPNLEILADGSALAAAGVDGVICSSQAHRHLSDCSPLIEAGVPLFLDKPLAPDYDTARSILNLVRHHDAPMMSCSVRRFSRNYAALIESIQTDRIGTVLFAECFEPHGCSAGYWQDRIETSGGLAVNYGVHVADPLVRALGTNIESVHAYGAKAARPDVASEDTAVFHARWASGAVGIGKISGGYRFGEGKPVPTVGHLIVHGSEGALETYIDESDVKIYRGGNFGADPSYQDKGGNAGALAAFVNMMETGVRPVPLEEMEAVMKLLDGVRRSIDTGEVIRFGSPDAG